jgi:RNA polymerase sigma-70 factor, ECF subfamily
MSAADAVSRNPVVERQGRRRPSVHSRADRPSLPARAAGGAAPRAGAAREDRSDLQLVQEAQGGNGHAFELLIWKHQSRVLNVAKGIVGEADAPDVAQEAFLKCYRALGQFRGQSAFYTWLYSITVNTCRNHLQSLRRRPANQDIDAAEAEHSGYADRLSDHETPERAAMAEEVGYRLTRAVNRLPQDLREALLMREVEGMSYEEIAEAMDCPIGTVRSRLFRARDAVDGVVAPLLAP